LRPVAPIDRCVTDGGSADGSTYRRGCRTYLGRRRYRSHHLLRIARSHNKIEGALRSRRYSDASHYLGNKSGSRDAHLVDSGRQVGHVIKSIRIGYDRSGRTGSRIRTGHVDPRHRSARFSSYRASNRPAGHLRVDGPWHCKGQEQAEYGGNPSRRWSVQKFIFCLVFAEGSEIGVHAIL
jgi:hypothetical protein